jgi:cell division protein WhiA
MAGAAPFAETVRAELVQRPPARECCRRSLLSALVRHAGTVTDAGVRLDLAGPAPARLVRALARPMGVDVAITAARAPRFERHLRARVTLLGPRVLQLMDEIGVLSPALAPLAAPPRRVVARRCCRAAHLRGGLVAAGSVSAPRSPAHLEIRAATTAAAAAVAALAAEEGVPLAVAARRDHAIAYAKAKPAVRDLLALAGAHDAVLAYEEADVLARTRERANRVTNFDRSNLRRLGEAARAQRRAIERLDLESLDPGLRRVAELRLRHPHLSLAELGKRARPPLPKATVAGRMRILTIRARSFTDP